jgi:hypothetical protein
VDADRDFALANGVARMASKVVALDFDGCLYPFVDVYAAPKPHADMVALAKKLKRAGFRIVVFTSRLSPTWLDHSGDDYLTQYTYIVGLLERDGIPFDDVTAEKVPAFAYVDDRAIRYNGNGKEIADFILFSHATD